MIHEATWYTKISKLQGRYDGAMELKSKLYLCIILLINYIVEDSRSSKYYIMLILHNPINPLNVVSTNIFPSAFNFTALTTWCTNHLRRLQFRHKIHLFLLAIAKRKKIMLFPSKFTNKRK